MFFIKFRVPIIVVSLVITLFLGMGLTKMTKENGLEALIPTDNPDYKFFKEMEDEFGATDQIVIGLSFKDSVYKKENLRIIDDLSLFLQDDENIEEDNVTSLTLIDNIDGIDQELIIEPLLPEDEVITEEIAKSVAKKVRDNNMLRGKIVSSDEKSSVVVITIDSDISLNAEILDKLIKRITDKLESLEKEHSDIKIYRSGMVSVKEITSKYMAKDMATMFPIAIVLVLVILLILLRSLSGVIMPLLVTIFSIVWTLGLKGWLGSPLTITETVIPVMLIAIGCADGVHIVSEFLELTRAGNRVKDSIIKTMGNLKTPIILTSLTTSLGFFSLVVAPGVSIKNMGIFLGIGVIAAMLFSLLFVPAIISFKKDKDIKSQRKVSPVDISKIGRLIIKGRFIIIILSLAVLSVSILGMKNVEVETDQIMFLKDNDPLKVATKELQKRLGGVNTLDIVFEGEEEIFKDPEILKFINDLEEYAREKEVVGYTLSITDYIKKIYYEFNDKNQDFNRLPKSTEILNGEKISGRDTVSNLLLLYEMGGGEIDKFVNSDYSLTKVSLRLLETKQADMENLINDLDLWLENNSPNGLTHRYSNDYIRVVMGDLITRSQVRSFISTLLAIILLLMIIFKSPFSGLLTALPVIIAVCFNFGLMWLTGTTLNIGTSIIASVGMGVGIDYSIHFFQRYKSFYKETKNNHKSIILAINQSIKPILTNAVAVGLGFLTLLFSNYYIIAGIGWITGLSMLTTALCALFVLPAYLAVFNPLKRKRSKPTMKKGLIALFLLASASLFSTESADDIMLQNSLLAEPINSSNTTQMILINKKGKKKVRKMLSYSNKTDKGEDKFIEFILPKDVKGTKFLTIGLDNADDDQRIFLPALKKVRKISSSNKNGKFMGSDITYYDMESKALDEYTYKLLKEDVVDNRDCWVIESYSRDKDSPYSKVINYVSKDNYFIYKKEMFDKKEKFIKTILVIETADINGLIIPVKTVIENHKDNHKTLLSLSDITVNQDMDKKIFSIQNLK